FYFLFSYGYGDHRDLHSFPTRRSSDLLSKYFHHVEVLSDKKENNYSNLLEHLNIDVGEFLMVGNSLKSDILPILNIGARAVHVRSEEHTSELQSRENLVCRLLLEKKKE